MSSSLQGKFDKMLLTQRDGPIDPDWYLTPLCPGHTLNWSGVNDPKLTEMIKLQRRTDKEKKRREIVYDIQRHFSQQVYFTFGASVSAVATWMPYVRDFGPNIGPDYGGRLVAARLDKETRALAPLPLLLLTGTAARAPHERFSAPQRKARAHAGP